MPILLTGAAGFIGYHVSRALLARGETVIGVDNLNDYYDVGLKEARLAQLTGERGFSLRRASIADRAAIEELCAAHPDIDRIVHLAAQAGVRYSLVNPFAYTESNITGQVVMLEAARRLPKLVHMVYASSSSVYGGNTKLPFAVEDRVDHPLSLYAATKKADELMSETYAHLFRLPLTGLRFFTVYGPWGRPDMAMWLFADAIMRGRPIKLFNHGRMRRDFTYVDDVAEAVARLVPRPPAPNPAWSGDAPDPATSRAPWHVYNIGNSHPVEVTEVVRLIEAAVGKPAVRELLPMQPGDVPETCADVSDLERAVGFRPKTPIAEGIRRFIGWFLRYHQG
jgi:UDP-glucuronate 4-epimerase